MEMLRRLYSDCGVSTESPRSAIAFPRTSSWRSTARSRRAHGVLGAATARARRARGVQSVLTASFINFIFKTARRYLRKRHSSSDSGGLTHTFVIRFLTSSIDIRIGGKNKKLKAVKNRGKGTRVSSPRPKVTDSRNSSPLCEQEQAAEEPSMSLRGRSQTNSPSSCSIR